MVFKYVDNGSEYIKLSRFLGFAIRTKEAMQSGIERTVAIILGLFPSTFSITSIIDCIGQPRLLSIIIE